MNTMFFMKERRTGITAKHLKQLQPDVNRAALPAGLKYKSKRFGLINTIDSYLRLKICDVLDEIFI